MQWRDDITFLSVRSVPERRSVVPACTGRVLDNTKSVCKEHVNPAQNGAVLPWPLVRLPLAPIPFHRNALW
jgi:hypothetical protein